MRKLIWVVLLALTVTAAGYAASPLLMAMDLKRAVKQGDVATLDARVDWPAVRASLKASLAEIERAKDMETTARGLPRPSLWSRIKAAASPTRYADQIIDRYVTPDGVVKASAMRGGLKLLLGKGNATQAAVASEDEIIADEARPLLDRMQRFWARLKRVEFRDLTTIEMEVQDRRVPERRYVSEMQFRNGSWQVTSVRVVGAGF